MTRGLVLIVLSVACVFARNSYTGGYSGAPGRQACASSCHGGTSGTIVVSGFPTTYQPGRSYRVVVRRNGGALIINFNATTRIGSTATVAGTFAIVTNSALYSGADGGVYANPRAIDSAVFQWIAPAGGTGLVKFYCAGYQGTTSSANGQSTRITLSANEITTSVESSAQTPNEFTLGQNNPNPFNPSTVIHFRLETASHVSLNVFDVGGRMLTALVDAELKAGRHQVAFDASEFASGVYFYRMETKRFSQTKKMLLAK